MYKNEFNFYLARYSEFTISDLRWHSIKNANEITADVLDRQFVKLELNGKL